MELISEQSQQEKKGLLRIASAVEHFQNYRHLGWARGDGEQWTGGEPATEASVAPPVATPGGGGMRDEG